MRLRACGLAWVLLALLLPAAGADSSLAELLDRALQRVGPTLRLPPGTRPEVWVAGSTAEFTAHTGAPPFAAGRYLRGVICLQPLPLLRRRGILERTLAHETVHFCLERLAGPGCPRWLAEGLAGLLAGEDEDADEVGPLPVTPPDPATLERDLGSPDWATARLAEVLAVRQAARWVAVAGWPGLTEALQAGRRGDWGPLQRIGTAVALP